MIEYNQTLATYVYVDDEFRTLIKTPEVWYPTYNGSYGLEMHTLDGSTSFFNPILRNSYPRTLSSRIKWIEQGAQNHLSFIL